MEETNAIAGISYEDYKANKQLVTDWYTLAIAEEAALFARTEERAMDYYRLMVSTIDHADDDTMDDAMENFYDAIYKAWSATSSTLYRNFLPIFT